MSVSVVGIPSAMPLAPPKLLRMSLRTTPLSLSTFDTWPLTVLEPSEGYGPAVSSAAAGQESVPVEVLLEDELPLSLLLLEVVVAPEPSSPPQPASNIAPPDSVIPCTRRTFRCRDLFQVVLQTLVVIINCRALHGWRLSAVRNGETR